jgi:hypothetical protein
MVFEFTPEIENNYIDASLLLISYFISFYLQMYFIARFLSKKRGGERGRRETEEGHPILKKSSKRERTSRH